MIEVLDTNGVQLLTPGAGIIPAYHQVFARYRVLKPRYTWHYVGSWGASGKYFGYFCYQSRLRTRQ